MDKKRKRLKRPQSIKDLLQKWEFDPDRKKSQRYVKHEFQDYGVRLAYKLNDLYHKSLYIRLAKTVKRSYLEQAYNFAVDYPNMQGKNRGKLFMWALARLKKGKSISQNNSKIKNQKSKPH
jgi:hypothetical protein